MQPVSRLLVKDTGLFRSLKMGSRIAITRNAVAERHVEDPDLPKLEQVVERLIEMQQRGAPILTPPKILRLFADNFREKKGTRGGHALSDLTARFFHSNRWPRAGLRAGLRALSANRKYSRAERRRNLVQPGGTGDTREDRGLRSPLPYHVPFAENARGQNQYGHAVVEGSEASQHCDRRCRVDPIQRFMSLHQWRCARLSKNQRPLCRPRHEGDGPR